MIHLLPRNFRLHSSHLISSAEMTFFAFSAVSSDLPVPTSISNISSLSNAEEWNIANQSEINSLLQNDTWILVDLPAGRQAIKCGWVWRIKLKEDNSVLKYKSRLCAKGYSQVHGIDYFDTFAPTGRIDTLRLFLHLCIQFQLTQHQIDIVSAFLMAPLHEDIYMTQPPGFISSKFPDKVCKLQKSIYGLKQAPRLWNFEMNHCLTSLGFTAHLVSPCIYIKTESDSTFSLIFLWVDDIIIGSTLARMQSIKDSVALHFQITDLGQATYFLGLQFERNTSNKHIFIHQSKLISSVISQVQLLDASPVPVPMDPYSKLSISDCPADAAQKLAMTQFPYRSVIGSLLYLSLCTRPDISSAVNILSRYVSNPGMLHWQAVKFLVRYLLGTSSCSFLKLSCQFL